MTVEKNINSEVRIKKKRLFILGTIGLSSLASGITLVHFARLTDKKVSFFEQ